MIEGQEWNSLPVSSVLLIALAGFIAIIMVLGIIAFATIWIKNQTKVNGLIFCFVLCFAMSIIVDCLRIFIIYGVKADYPEFDFFGFIVKSTTIFLAIAFIGFYIIIQCEYVEAPLRYSRLLVYYLFSLVLIFTGMSIFSSFRTPPTGEFDFHLYQIGLPMIFVIFLAYLPITIILFRRTLNIVKLISNRKIRFRLSLLTYLTLSFVVERGCSIGLYAFVNSTLSMPIEDILLLDFISLTGLSCLLLFIIFKYRGMVESLSTFFSLKKLYILKNNGILMQEYDFENKRFVESLDSADPLIGGFIYAICEGLKEILKSKEEATSFSSGKRTLIIQRGRYLLTVLVVTENSAILHQKLLHFLNLYETHYKADLETWKGEISLFDRTQIQKWIAETISES